MKLQSLFYEDRFLESWAGAIITNPATAIVELVANCWDAYATEVNNQVKITPLLYDTILIRAEKRLLNLYTKVKDAPFLVAQQEELNRFIEPLSVRQSDLPT